MRKSVLLILAVVFIVCAVAISGTAAWLAVRVSVTNTFTVGDISISLTETTGSEYKLVPGAKIAKDPVVTVHKGSVNSWLFVKIEKENNLDEYVLYALADGWTELSDGVYYRESFPTAEDVAYNILKDNAVYIKDSVTEGMLASIKSSGNLPSMSFKAYAIQRSSHENAADAWEYINNL